LAGSGSELAVLPLGTRNHFARQLGLTADLSEAAKLAAQGHAVAIDLGQAAGQTFINNASLGAYVELVRERDRVSLPKLPASVIAGWRVLRKLRPRSFGLEIDGRQQCLRSAMLFIGNNLYEVLEGRPGKRGSLDDGVLSLFALAPLTRGGVVRSAVRVMVGRPDPARDFALVTTAKALRIDGAGETEIALDGELIRLPLPLELAIRPGALRVVVPSDWPHRADASPT
jgi:diacylglycerol kinase family enzyme